ncbi:serine/threonine protein kinase, partial [Streptomyces chiangmaiensis]|nr:serine/threonine protein kinase [Streptomyces chiangmaiensis]
LLAKDPQQRLDDRGARAMLDEVLHAPDLEEEVPADATRVVALPPLPEGPSGKAAEDASGPGVKRGEEAAERLRGALRSVRKAAVSAGAATAAAATAARSKGSGSATAEAAEDDSSGIPAAPADGTPGVPRPAAASSGTRDTTAVFGSNSDSAKPSSGWPLVPDPDRPPRPAQPPRAPLTDVMPKRTLVIVAVVVALAVLGTVLALTLRGGDSGSRDNKKGSTKAAVSSGATAGSGTKGGGSHTDSDTATEGPGEQNTTDSSPAASAGASGSGSSASPDDEAVKTYKGGQGYSIGLPDGWRYRSSDSAGDRFTGPDGQRLLVAWTSTPKDDPVADWENQEGYMTRSQYKRIRIAQVDYRGWNTADWEFSYSEKGTTYRVIDRGFVVNSHQGYALLFTAKASDWDSDPREDTWKALTGTFRPKS